MSTPIETDVIIVGAGWDRVHDGRLLQDQEPGRPQIYVQRRRYADHGVEGGVCRPMMFSLENHRS